MTPHARIPPRIVGCDVGKKTITVFDTATGRTGEITNDLEALLAFAQDLPPGCLGICEATGGSETGLLLATMEAGIPVHRADARKLKAFIRSRGTLGKASMPEGSPATARSAIPNCRAGSPPAECRTSSAPSSASRTQLVKQRAALSNQIKAPSGAIAKKRLQALHNAVSEQIAAIEVDIRQLIERDPAMAAVVAIIKAIPDPHRRHRRRLDARDRLHERPTSRIARRLAPHPHQSGQRDGYRRTRGGRPEVKRALFMAAMAAQNHNPALRAVYERLIHNGKKPLLAITALMRKLITIINARVRDSLYAPAPN